MRGEGGVTGGPILPPQVEQDLQNDTVKTFRVESLREKKAAQASHAVHGGPKRGSAHLYAPPPPQDSVGSGTHPSSLGLDPG